MSWIWRRLGFRKPLYHFWFLLCLLAPVSASGQVAAGTFTTVKATSSTSTAVCVGCPIGSTTPAANSGITAATMVLPSGVPSVTTNKLYSSGGALFFNGLALATGSSISGTTNTVAKFTAATVLGDSIITDSGTTVTVAGALNANGNIMTGTSGTEGNFLINGPAGSNRVIGWRTATVNRWFAYATSVAESGANAGSNWRLDAYNDAGTVIGTAILATRSSLAITLGGALTVTGTSALSGATTVATSLQLTGAAPVYLANSNNGYLFRNAADGATLMSITNAGAGTFTNAWTVSGAATNSTTLAQVGVATFTAQPILSSLTASQAVFTDGSKGLVSNAITGSGNVVMSASPTLTGTLTAATFTQSGTTRLGTSSTTGGWGVNAAGDFTLGGSSHISDSTGTPTIGSGFGSGPTIIGTDYSFTVSLGSGAGNTGGNANFGHTWTTAPICVASTGTAAVSNIFISATTTFVTVAFTSGTYSSSDKINVLCRSY